MKFLFCIKLFFITSCLTADNLLLDDNLVQKIKKQVSDQVKDHYDRICENEKSE